MTTIDSNTKGLSRRRSGGDLTDFWRIGSQILSENGDSEGNRRIRHVAASDSFLSSTHRDTNQLLDRKSSPAITAIRGTEQDDVAEERLRSIGLYWMAVLVCLT